MQNSQDRPQLDETLAGLVADRWQSSVWQWACLGFFGFAAIPVGFGICGFVSHRFDVSPLPPGMGRCGMGALGDLAIACVGGPLCGLMGAGAGWLAFQAFTRPPGTARSDDFTDGGSGN